jgi:hypothetical protein
LWPGGIALPTFHGKKALTCSTLYLIFLNWGKIYEAVSLREAFIGFRDIGVLKKR